MKTPCAQLRCKQGHAAVAQRICLLPFANQSLNCLVDLAFQWKDVKREESVHESQAEGNRSQRHFIREPFID